MITMILIALLVILLAIGLYWFLGWVGILEMPRRVILAVVVILIILSYLKYGLTL